MLTHAIRFSAHGGPEVLRWEALELPDPGPGEIRIRHHAIGVNFIDTYHRTGLYPVSLPSGLGQEGAGVVEAVGPGVTEFRPGDRVVYCGGSLSPVGAYSEVRNFPAERAVRLPDDISFETAAAVMLKGLTAQFLVRRTHRVQPGDTVLIHAAAGGVGLLLVQWAKRLGATVIATAGNDEKAELVRAHGADHVIVYTRENFTERTRALTNGRGVDVVYDSVGRATFLGSLDSLRPLGLMVSFGNASGKVEPFDIGLLAQKGSLFLTRPTLFTYIAEREDLLAMAEELFTALRDGWLDVQIGQRFPLSQATEAHRALESRRTTGATLLLP
ncbi:NADPH:quinone reductase [Tepidiphilus sp. B18-69]|uniref:NADPH:quinone reductase n=1 Tax=Tepidiphilus baoligensis TaxID=2698687 RepID=A0ABX1QJ65_9PROT|nr:quinone oxidoreductase [Tepidiphilus baoligensis]NMH15977.1 NADPH:quinone reductase [Tepidiphilus baoligensis]